MTRDEMQAAAAAAPSKEEAAIWLEMIALDNEREVFLKGCEDRYSAFHRSGQTVPQDQLDADAALGKALSDRGASLIQRLELVVTPAAGSDREGGALPN
jgi:5-formyltetrahydrofolate cyclo-ligase